MRKDLDLLLSYTKKVGECLEWTRCLNTDGYARAVIDGNNNAKVHRVVYELVHGSIPSGLLVRHTCDNPKCINPKHLLVGSPKENNHDKFLRNRQPRVVTKEMVSLVNCMLELTSIHPTVQLKDIAKVVGVDPRRVSDIKNGKYCSATGKFLGHG